MKYSREYLVHYYEIDRERKLTLPALMHYFEDIATLDSEARGFTLEHYARTGQVFLLLKWDVVIRSWPGFNETLRIETRPTTFKRFLANREYAVFGKDGRPLAEAQSVWVFTDVASRRPVRVPDEMYAGFGVPRDSEKSFVMLEDLPAIIEGTFIRGIKVRNTDLDNNDHVNNVRYVEWALESLPREFVRDRTVSRVKVHYKKELQAGGAAEIVSGTVERDGRLFSHHTILCGDTDICNLRLEWKT